MCLLPLLCLSVSLPQLTGQCSSSTVQIKTQELSREYERMLNDLRGEKDRELQNLRVNKEETKKCKGVDEFVLNVQGSHAS